MDVSDAMMPLSLIDHVAGKKKVFWFLFNMVVHELAIRGPQNKNLWKQCH